MFNSLKEKLKNWASKVKEEVLGVEEAKEKRNPKTAKTIRSSKSNKTKGKFKKGKSTKKQRTSSKGTQEEIQEITPISREITKKPRKKNKEQEETTQILLENQELEKPNQRSFFSRLFKSELTQEKFEELFQELELTLLQNNVAYEVVEKIKQELSSRLIGKKDYSIEKELKEIINEILLESPNFIKTIKDSIKNKKPFVIALVGINGSGKTTTVAKLTNLLKKNKLSVCLAAADTYRAASIEQLEVHANKLEVPMIKKDYGSDPASIGFEAIQYAKKHSLDVVLIDTAGRLNNKESLLRELEKIIRVTQPDMKIFTGESTTGNDATEQAKTFDKLINLTGIILSKADIDEKGGTMISVGYITKKPILFLGTGQEYKDIEVFDKNRIISTLGLD